MCAYVLSHLVVSNSATPWTVGHQAPLSMGFSRQEYWSGLPGPPPGDLPNPGIKPESPTLQVDSLPAELSGKPRGTSIVYQLSEHMQLLFGLSRVFFAILPEHDMGIA